MNGIQKGLTAAAVLLTGAGTFAEPAAAQTSGVYYRATGSSIDLAADSTPVTIQKLTIPAGIWLITAKANVVNFGQADYARCQIAVGGPTKDAGATLIGNAAPGPTGEEGPSVAEIVLQTAVTASASRSVVFSCWHDFETTGIYVDPRASILVVPSPGPLE